MSFVKVDNSLLPVSMQPYFTCFDFTTFPCISVLLFNDTDFKIATGICFMTLVYGNETNICLYSVVKVSKRIVSHEFQGMNGYVNTFFDLRVQFYPLNSYGWKLLQSSFQQAIMLTWNEMSY